MADLTPESSRRARGFAVWAALRELGPRRRRRLVDRCCGSPVASPTAWQPVARRSLNEVVLNQVLVGFGDRRPHRPGRRGGPARRHLLARGGTTWRGRRLIREVSVSNGSTTQADIDVSAHAILDAARRTGALSG